MPRTLSEHTGVFASTRWRARDDSGFQVGFLEDKTCVAGNADEGELLPGVSYTFYGHWEEHAKHGKQFRFKQFVQKQAATRHGVVNYLMRHAPGIGPGIGAQLWDAYQHDAVKVLRTQPEAAAAACRHLTIEKARAAAVSLQALVATEEAKIALTDLFAGRGFPGLLVDACIKKWGILAPARVRRDPFCLLVEEMTGCGFARCDRLYTDLGLDLGKLKRQVICLWHLIRSDTSGDTWRDAGGCVRGLGQHMTGAAVQADKAIRLGLRSGWLAQREDSDGKLWLADGKRAANEKYLAERVAMLAASVVAVPVAPITQAAVA